MTNHPTTCILDTKQEKSQDTTPLTRQLTALFKVIPEEELLKALKVYYAGRRGYTNRVLWRTYVAMTVLNLPSFASRIRALQNNPLLAIACGIYSREEIPSKFAYSRFMRKLAQRKYLKRVKDVMRELTRRLYHTLPDFGKSVAIDSTDLKAWSNGNKKPVSDPDATWAAKVDTAGRKKFYYGYKLHLIADTQYELPIAANITTASINDVRVASRVLSQARFTYSKFRPKYIICDAGYSSKKLRALIRGQFDSQPIIKVNPSHKKALFTETNEWQAIYNRRTSIERLFSRLKGHRRLNSITVRHISRVTIHCFLSLIVTQAMALAFPANPRNCVSN